MIKLITPALGDVHLYDFCELNERDRLVVLRLRNHPEVQMWMYDCSDISVEDHISFIESLKNDSSRKYFLVKQSTEPIGVFYLTKLNDVNKSLELGLYINFFDRTKKAGSAIIESAISYIRSALKYKKVMLEVFEENTVAVNFYKRYGFNIASNSNVNDRMVNKMVLFMDDVL